MTLDIGTNTHENIGLKHFGSVVLLGRNAEILQYWRWDRDNTEQELGVRKGDVDDSSL